LFHGSLIHRRVRRRLIHRADIRDRRYGIADHNMKT
jgi:hypothetical protein